MGKAYRIPSVQSRLKRQTIDIKNLEALNRLRNTPRPVAATASSGSSAAGSTGGGTGNFLSLEGGTMIGNIAFDPKLLAVNNGRINLDPGGNPPENSSYVLVTGQGSPDDIRFIDGAERNGQWLIYQGTNQQIQNMLNANLLSLSGGDTINGNGATTVTVTTTNTGTLINGSQINVIGTNNFDIQGGVITSLITNVSFTYERTAGAPNNPESNANIQDGNILTQDGKTLVLDGTLSLTNAPIVLLIFDATAAGGAWRVISSLGGGGIVPITGGGSAFLRLTSDQAATGVVAFTNNVILGTGITDEGGGIFRLSGSRFIIESHLGIIANAVTDAAIFQWERADNLNFTLNPSNTGTFGEIFPVNASPIANDSSQGFVTAEIDATVKDIFVRLQISQIGTVTLRSTETSSFITNTLSVGTGGGGLTEPIILGINTLTPQTLPTKTTIAWNTKNPQKITLDKAVEFEFTSLPASGKYEGVLVIIDIDGTGGFASPIWPSSLVNPPVIPTTSLSRFSVMLYTIDGGTVVTHATSVGSSSSGSSFSGNLSDLVINTQKNWAAQGITNFGALSGVTGIDLDGATATIAGAKLINLFQADQTIDSLSTGIEYTAGNLQSHLFKSQTTDIAKFEESAADVFRLDMLNHAVKDAKDVSFDVLATFAGAGAVPVIGFDAAGNRLRINLPTGKSLIVTNNNTIGTTILTNGSVKSDIMDTKFFLINVSTTEPTALGTFRTVGSDVFVFSGGQSRNFSDIGIATGANTALSNLTTTSINQALLPSAADTRDFGSGLLPWRIIHGKQYEIITPSASAPSAASDTQLSRNITSTGATAINHFNFNVKQESGSSLSGQYDFYFDGATPVSITKTGTLTSVDAGAVDLTSHIQLQAQAITPVGIGRMSLSASGILQLSADGFEIRRSTTGTNFNNFNIVKVDASPANTEPIGDINFQVFDSPTTTTYAKVQGGILDTLNAGSLSLRVRADNQSTLALGLFLTGDDNVTGRSYLNVFARIDSNLNFGFDGTGSRKFQIHPLSAATKLGIVVQDNDGFTVGDEGTNAIPATVITNNEIISDAQADGLFGTHDGAKGIVKNSAVTNPKEWTRVDGVWYFEELTRGFP